MVRPLLFAAASAAGILAAVAVSPESADAPQPTGHMVGNQSRNRGLLAVPAPGKVTIDGNLEDWDFSGRMCSFADFNHRDQYSVETALMWDKDYLYVAFRWIDDTPMFNMVDPEFDSATGWKGDSFALRVATDHTFWITGYYYTGKAQSFFHLEEWIDPENRRAKGVKTVVKLTSKPHSTDLGEQVEMATKPSKGGYTQELRIPWKLLYRHVPEIKAGNKFQMGFEYVWGDPSGRTWPDHRYADNLQPGEDKILFFWEARNAWGDVTLSAQGNLPVRTYHPAGQTLGGPIKIELPIPQKSERFTVAIDDENGRRVRNLGGDLRPADYSTGTKDGNYQVRIRWDGRDDFGKPVPQGAYRVRGLWHEGLSAFLDTAFYNPGTPPWDTPDGTGGWGADHSPAKWIARSGDSIILGCSFAEGGDGIFAVGPDGRKKWGNKRGVVALAANDTHTFFIINASGRSGQLCRLLSQDGSYAPFKGKGEGEELPFEVDLEKIIPGFDSVPKPEGVLNIVSDLAASDKYLHIVTFDGRLYTLDAGTLEYLGEQKIPHLSRIACGPNGSLYGLAENRLIKIDPFKGATIELPTPGVAKSVDLDISKDGLIAIMDDGPDRQTKIFTAEGKPVGALARKGGRPIRGEFDPEAISHPLGIAFDTKGELWVTEAWDFPRRVSVWSPDGKLARDYIGTTEYAGTNGYLHQDDPELGYYGPIEMKLNRRDHSYEVTQILWVSDPDRADEPAGFNFDPGKFRTAKRFTSDAGGVKREFLFQPPHYAFGKPTVLYMEDEKGWRPVFAIGYVGHFSGTVNSRSGKVIKPAEGKFAALDPKDGIIWNDENEDGRVQFEECQVIPAPEGGKKWADLHLSGSADWNNSIIPEDLSFVSGNVYRFVPVRFTKSGAPIYGPAGITRLVDADFMGEVAPYQIPEDHTVVALRRADSPKPEQPNLAGFDTRTGKMVWSYPNDNPGVQGSHSAPMASPGLLIAPLKILGHAKVEGLGSVFGMRGNLGQDFYFTSDGLFIGALFDDGRMTKSTLGKSYDDTMGVPLNGQRDEPFSGWFARQKDGKYRFTTSVARQAVMVAELKGLETVHRFSGPEIRIDAAMEKAISEHTPQRAAADAPREYTIPRVGEPLPLENAKPWETVGPLEIASKGGEGNAWVRMAYDRDNLYLEFNVPDNSPWKNAGKDFRRLFKTGDGVDLQIGSKDTKNRPNPAEGDSRLFISQLGGEPVAILMRPADHAADKSLRYTYDSPVGPKAFDRVEPRKDVRLHVEREDAGYLVRAAVPWKTLAIDPQPGMVLPGDVGFISSDADGQTNVARTYWSNRETGLVSDEPLEAWFSPALWGRFTLGK